MTALYMPDGSREVEVIVHDGKQVLKVRDPRKAWQPLYAAGYVTPRYVKDGGQLVLAPVTVKELADMGVDMAQLTAQRPAIVPDARTDHPVIARRKGETVAAWNERKYEQGVGVMLREMKEAALCITRSST